MQLRVSAWILSKILEFTIVDILRWDVGRSAKGHRQPTHIGTVFDISIT
jgi:hypothetical protein